MLLRDQRQGDSRGPALACPFWPRRSTRSWQPTRDGERNEALDTFVYAHAALHGLISMGLRLNEEVVGVVGHETASTGATMGMIGSRWMA